MFYLKNDRPLKFMLLNNLEYGIDIYSQPKPVLYHLEEHFLEDHKDTYIIQSSHGTLKIQYDHVYDSLKKDKINNDEIDVTSLRNAEMKKYANFLTIYESSWQFTIDSIVHMVDVFLPGKYFSHNGAISGDKEETTYSNRIVYKNKDNNEEIVIGFIRIHVNNNRIRCVIVDMTHEENHHIGISENYQEIIYDEMTYKKDIDIKTISQKASEKIQLFYKNTTV